MTTSILEYLYQLRKKPTPISTCSPFLPKASPSHNMQLTSPFPSPSPKQPLIYFPSLWTCLSWTLRTNINHTVGSLWWLAFLTSSMFTRFIHLLSGTWFFFNSRMISHCIDIPNFVYLCIISWTFWLLAHSGYFDLCFYGHWCTSFLGNRFSIF